MLYPTLHAAIGEWRTSVERIVGRELRSWRDPRGRRLHVGDRRGIRTETREADVVRAAVTNEAPFSGITFRARMLRLRSRGAPRRGVSVGAVRAAVKNGELSLTRSQPLGAIGEQGARRTHPAAARLFRRCLCSGQTSMAVRTETARGLDGPVLGASGLRLVQTQTEVVNRSTLESVRAAREPC